MSNQPPGRETDMSEPSDNTVITVCSACLTASCWHGILYCEEARTAGTVERTVAELKALHLEHPDYWRPRRAVYKDTLGALIRAQARRDAETHDGHDPDDEPPRKDNA